MFFDTIIDKFNELIEEFIIENLYDIIEAEREILENYFDIKDTDIEIKQYFDNNEDNLKLQYNNETDNDYELKLEEFIKNHRIEEEMTKKKNIFEELIRGFFLECYESFSTFVIKSKRLTFLEIIHMNMIFEIKKINEEHIINEMTFYIFDTLNKYEYYNDFYNDLKYPSVVLK